MDYIQPRYLTLGSSQAADEFRATVIKALSMFTSADRAGKIFDEGIATIKGAAAEGAATKVRPYVIGALALGALGVVIGGVALLRRR